MKLTFIWQESGLSERDWIREIFAHFEGEQILDGERRIVLDDCLLIDNYLHARPAEYYAQFRGRNAWLLHLSDETYEAGYDAYANFRGVFRNYWSSVFLPQRVFQFPLGYGDGLIHDAAFQSPSDRKLLWSFVGEAAKASRPEMLHAFAPLEPQLVLQTDSPGRAPLSRLDYQQTLLDSVFVPCPMGNVSLESFRIYEALESGAIPLLEKRFFSDYFSALFGPHPLPAFNSWRQAAQFVASVRSDSKALDQLRQQCLTWWVGYKTTLSARIEDFFAVTTNAPPAAALRWNYRVPAWQHAELLRYQSLSTLSRRLSLQTARLLRERRLRKTFGK